MSHEDILIHVSDVDNVGMITRTPVEVYLAPRLGDIPQYLNTHVHTHAHHMTDLKSMLNKNIQCNSSTSHTERNLNSQTHSGGKISIIFFVFVISMVTA